MAGSQSFLQHRTVELLDIVARRQTHALVPNADACNESLRAELTIAGHNLVTWTNYRGFDPEVSYQRPDVLRRQEHDDLPLPRELIVRLDGGPRGR